MRPALGLALLFFAACGHAPLRAPSGPVQLPRDEAAHPDAQTEWWYFLADVATPAGERYDVLLSFAHHRTSEDTFLNVPLGGLVDPFRWAYCAVTDRQRKLFRGRARYAYPDFWVASESAAGLALGHGSWQARASEQGFAVHGSSGEYAFDLDFTPMKPAALHGPGGFAPIVGTTQHYYSYTRLAVRGTLSVGGKAVEVQGAGWYDHEYGFIYSRRYRSWEWLGLRLDTGEDVMVARYFDRSGKLVGSMATWVGAGGDAENVDGPRASIERIGHVEAVPSFAIYPAALRLKLPDRELDVTVTPVVGVQEILGFPMPLFEGAVTVKGTLRGKPVSGEGQLELAGQVQPAARAFYRSGMPGDER